MRPAFPGPRRKVEARNRFGLRAAALAAGLALSLAAAARAAFLDPLWSARVAALGGAFTALSDDATAVFYNPAASVKMLRRQTNFTYARLFTGYSAVDLSLSQFAYVQPLRSLSVIGVGWGNFTSSRLHREDTLVLSYARHVKDFWKDGDIAAAVSVRYLSQEYVLDERAAGDPVFQGGRRAQNATFDLHVFTSKLAETAPNLSLGLSIRSLTRPDVGFSERERLPLEVAVGGLYQWRNLVFPLDLVRRGDALRPHAGVEALFLKNKAAVRFGSDTLQLGSGFGYQQDLSKNFTVALDYSFLWPLKFEENAGSHRATVGLKF
jgi:hypothetical protein